MFGFRFILSIFCVLTTLEIPAFDPRPGRTNVNAITEVEVPAPDNTLAPEVSPSKDCCIAAQPKLHLILRGPNLPGVNNF